MENTYKSFVEEILKNETTSGQATETVVAESEENNQQTETTPATETAQEPAQQSAQQTQAPASEQTATEPTETNEGVVEKQWYDDDSETTTTTTPQTVAPTAAQEVETKLPPELEDEEIKLLIDYKKSGKTLKDFVQEYNVVDYASLEDSKIIEMGLKQLEGFTGDEYEEASNEVETMTLFQKKKLVRDFREQFESINREKLKELSTFENAQASNQKVAIEKFNTELEGKVKEITGKERYGLKITDEMSTTLKKFVAEEMTFQKPDGSLDVEALLDVALWRKYGKDLVRANVTRAKNEGREEILRQTTNPSTNSGPSNLSSGFGNDNLTDAFTQYLNNKK